MNGPVLERVEKSLGPKVKGLELTEQTLDAINEMVLEALESQFPELRGLRDYLDGLKFVTHGGGAQQGR
jgi:hypothetical protein